MRNVVFIILSGIAMGLYAEKSEQGMPSVPYADASVVEVKQTPTSHAASALRQQGKKIVNYALNRGSGAWKSLYTSDFRRAVERVDRKFFSDEDNMDMGCDRVFLEYQLSTTYINQRVSDIRVKSVKATSATHGNIIMEYTWETEDGDGCTYHKELRTFKMRKEQGKWLIDDILIAGDSSKKFFKNIINQDIFC